MSKLTICMKHLRRDEDGAALIEYSVLLGVLVVTIIVTTGLVGTWINGKWMALNAVLPT